MPFSAVCGGKPADVIFVLDTSSSIWIDDFLVQQDFVSDVVDIFDIGPWKIQVGLVTFSDNASVAFHLNTFQDKASIQNAVKAINYTGGKTYTADALSLVKSSVMSARNGFRKSVAHVTIVITDGMSAEPEKTKSVAAKLKKEGMYVFAIGKKILCVQNVKKFQTHGNSNHSCLPIVCLKQIYISYCTDLG